VLQCVLQCALQCVAELMCVSIVSHRCSVLQCVAVRVAVCCRTHVCQHCVSQELILLCEHTHM